ncbi:MAG: hypothetical protein ACRD2R_02905 [Terriglobales bacterium]
MSGQEFPEEVCRGGCGKMVSVTTCCCGEEMGGPYHDNHTPVPMGCECHFDGTPTDIPRAADELETLKARQKLLEGLLDEAGTAYLDWEKQADWERRKAAALGKAPAPSMQRSTLSQACHEDGHDAMVDDRGGEGWPEQTYFRCRYCGAALDTPEERRQAVEQLTKRPP